MPKQSITALRNAIETATEMSEQHREEMLTLVDALALDVAEVEAEGAADHERVEKLRSAIASAEQAIRQRGGDGDHHELSERLTELEEKAELVALEHPVVANALAAIARLI